MKKIGFVTSEEDPNLTADDLLAFPALAKLLSSAITYSKGVLFMDAL